MVPGFSLSSSEHVEHAILFGVPLITVPIHLSVHEVLPLLVGRVYTIVKLVWVLDFAGGVTGAASRAVATAVSGAASV